MFGKKKKTVPFISAVIAAAGEGRRMGGIDKQQVMLLDGMPVIAHSIRQFQECPRIAEIIVVCQEENVADYYHIIRDFDLDKVASVVAGGEERQSSVFAGISACNPDADFYAVHDGARPLVLLEIIESCISEAIKHGAAAVGVPVKDTIKIEGKTGFINSTVDRSTLRAIQTPQIFEAKAYHRAMSLAKSRGHTYTDDCQLMEHAGKDVFIAPGSYDNIKITTPEDIAHANAILSYRMGGLGMFGQEGYI